MQIYKDSNQVVPFELQEIVFTDFIKDNIDNLMRQPMISMSKVHVSLSVYELARRDIRNDLVGAAGDFSLPQFYTYGTPSLKKYEV